MIAEGFQKISSDLNTWDGVVLLNDSEKIDTVWLIATQQPAVGLS